MKKQSKSPLYRQVLAIVLSMLIVVEMMPLRLLSADDGSLENPVSETPVALEEQQDSEKSDDEGTPEQQQMISEKEDIVTAVIEETENQDVLEVNEPLEEPVIADKDVENELKVGELNQITIDGDYSIRYKFVCAKDGLYSIIGEDLHYYFRGIGYEIFGSNEDGSINYNDYLTGNNEEPSGAWYQSTNNQMVLMEEGKTYFVVFHPSQNYQYNTHTRKFSLVSRSVQFTVTNESEEDVARDVTLAIADVEYAPNATCLAYVFGDFKDLKNSSQFLKTDRHDANRITMTLAPAESKTVTAVTAVDWYSEEIFSSIDWFITAKYDSDTTITYSGDYYGSYQNTEINNQFSMSFKHEESIDEGEKTVFRSIADFSDVQVGAHYIFVIRNGSKFYALADDENGFITQVELKEDTIQIPTTIYAGYTMEVSSKDITQSDYVMNCFKASNVGQDWSSDVKFYTNYRNPNTGKRVAMKLGYHGGDWDSTMFSISSGSLQLSKYNGALSVYHDPSGTLMLCEKDGETYFRWNYRRDWYNNETVISRDVILLTDAKPKEKEPLQGEQPFYKVTTSSLSSTVDKEFALVYHDPGSGYYALTAEGTMKLDWEEKEYEDDRMPPEYSPFKDMTYPGKANIEISYSWSACDVPYGKGMFNDNSGYYDGVLVMNGVARDKKYLNPAVSSLVNEDKTEVIFLMTENVCTELDENGNPKDLNDYNNMVNHIADTIVGIDPTRVIGWDKENKQFILVDSYEKAVPLVVYQIDPEAAKSNWQSFHQVNDLTNIEDWKRLVITVTDADGSEKVLLPGYNCDLQLGEIGNSKSENICAYQIGDTLNVQAFGVLTPGSLISDKNMNFKISSLIWKNWLYGEVTLYMDGYPDTMVTDGREKQAMFTYTADGTGIIIRGAKKWLHYDSETGQFSGVEDKSDATPIHLWALGATTDDNRLTEVIYHSPNGGILSQLRTEKDIDMFKLPDTTFEGTEYTFVGWSVKQQVAGFLSVDDSCDIYEFDDAVGVGDIKADIIEKLGLLGNCTTEIIDSVPVAVYKPLAVDNRLDLYPVFAVRSFDKAVTANDGDTMVVGISDWKDLQPTASTRAISIDAETDTKQRWLGKVYCTVYKDGELWADSLPMYFRYHNDDAADINLKFISDELLANYQNAEDPLYAFMSDTTVYPENSQVGNYKIDAVYALQGGSEDGLKYKYNWMSDHGGQLDNVKGGSTIYVYVTSLYQVEYFLDDVELTDDTWQNPEFYATPGTENSFAEKEEAADFSVRMDNEYKALMDGSITDDSVFLNETLMRGGYSGFAYWIADYPHTIPVAELPEAPEGKVLTSDKWLLKNEDLKDDVAAKTDYPVTGTSYGTGNTIYSWTDTDDDAVNTYHLYIYTDELISVDVTKKWEGDSTDSITVNLLADGEVVDTAVITAEEQWQHTFLDLRKHSAKDGHEIVYTVEEEAVENYITEITGSVEDGFEITNTYNLMNIFVKKVWVETTDKFRPVTVTVNLLANGELVDTYELKELNGWSHYFLDLPVYDENHEVIEYTVEEIKVDKYDTKVEGNAEEGFVITNTLNYKAPDTGDNNMPVYATMISSVSLVLLGIAVVAKKKIELDY